MQIIKTVADGEIPNYGLSRQWHGSGLNLRLPLFPWYGRAYQIAYDDIATGWHMKELFIRFGTANRVIRADKWASGFTTSSYAERS